MTNEELELTEIIQKVFIDKADRDGDCLYGLSAEPPAWCWDGYLPIEELVKAILAWRDGAQSGQV